MTKLGILVGEENWTFFREIADDLQTHYQTQIYQPHTLKTPLLQGRLNDWAQRQALRSMLRNNDVCFFEWASDLLAPASHMAKACTIVTRLHSFELHRWAPRIQWDNVDKIILVSNTMAAMFRELYPAHAHKTTVIYNGAALTDYAPPAQKPFQFRLGMLCNISPVKRVYEIVLALHVLRQQGYDAQLAIAGKTLDARYMASIQHLVKKLGLDSHVSFDGYVTDTPAWLQTIDIFISNSYWEGQQVALLEAMAAGCYCLSHWWAGAEEMLREENLFITECELTEKILAYAALDADEQAQRQRCLQTLAREKFDIQATKVGIRQVLAEVTEG